jgi:hypothetical protein
MQPATMKSSLVDCCSCYYLFDHTYSFHQQLEHTLWLDNLWLWFVEGHHQQISSCLGSLFFIIIVLQLSPHIYIVMGVFIPKLTCVFFMYITRKIIIIVCVTETRSICGNLQHLSIYTFMGVFYSKVDPQV